MSVSNGFPNHTFKNRLLSRERENGLMLHLVIWVLVLGIYTKTSMLGSAWCYMERFF